MQDIVRTGLLFDFYGAMLTQRQKNIMVFYLHDNFSLSEISEKLGISRQGVHDIIKRATAKLEMFEKRLGLYEKMKKNNRLADEAVRAVKNGNVKLAEEKIRLLAEG